MNRILLIVAKTFLVLGAILSVAWLLIAAQGGGPPPTHKRSVLIRAERFLNEEQRWPHTFEELLSEVPQSEAWALTEMMRGTKVTFFRLADGHLLIQFEWRQFGYARGSYLLSKMSQPTG